MRSKQPAQGTFDRHHAVVIGGSMAGLLAARVLSDHFAQVKGLFIFGRPPDDKRGGVIFPIQGGYWMVTLVGSLHDYPPDDEAGFLEFARSLAQLDLYEAIKDAEAVMPIAVYRYTANRWRHFERMDASRRASSSWVTQHAASIRCMARVCQSQPSKRSRSIAA
nr:hypothetical protein [Chloroflexota bacterium]